MPQKNRLVSNKVMFSVKVKRTKAMQPRKIVIDNNTFWFTFFVIIVAKAEPHTSPKNTKLPIKPNYALFNFSSSLIWKEADGRIP